MVFTSLVFVRFLAVVLLGLWLMPSRTLRQLLLLVASAYFYAYWKPSYLLLLLTPSVIDYYCALRVEDTEDPRRRRFWVTVSVVTNLALLGYFKYTNFFVGNVSALIGRPLPHLDILLPVGISFYTFKTLSYTIDVYRREIPACRSLWRYAMFVTYFPELVAGPIVRASVFLPQMTRSLRPSWQRAVVGAQVALLGVTKKLFIADRLAVCVDPVFADPGAFSPLTVLSAVVAYSLQIYCDFSGYSDIAIGVSKIIGFDLPENFNMPYLATSLVEFWRRWHMTLSGWLRDYLYIPLGGNRKGKVRTYVNLMATMLLGGLWHGASWNFVLWGALHGGGLAANHWWTRDRPSARRRSGPATSSRLGRLAAWCATYAFVCAGWVFFRARTFTDALIIFRKVLGLDQTGVQWLYAPLLMILPIVVFAHLLGLVAERQRRAPGAAARRFPAPAWARALYRGNNNRFAVKPSRAAGVYVLLPLPGFWGGFTLTAWLVGLYLFASASTSPFIYFRF